MWDDTYSKDKASRSNIRRIVYHVVFATIGVIIFAIVSNQSVNLFMNVVEFGSIFTKPLYYSLVSGLILSSIALVRVDFRDRNSMCWYAFRLIIDYLRDNNYELRSARKIRYSDQKMGKVSFLVWQITKIMIFAPLFSSLIFGMAVIYLFEGNDLGLTSIPNIFMLPFANISLNSNFAQDNVIPMVPALTLIIPALLSAVGFRIFLYIGVAGSINVASQYIADITENKPKFLSYISTVETIIGIALLWTAFTMFFSYNINYNTKYAILGTFVIGIAFIGYGFLDKKHATLISFPVKKHIYVRFLTILIVVIAAGSIMAINNSIAYAKKIEWMGPYVAQEIAVNRYIAELDKVQIVNYDVRPSPPSISPSKIQDIVNENNDTLNNIRLWDQQAAENKLKAELGQRNDFDFAYTNVLRFNNTMFWAAPTTPSLPVDITRENRWYNEHLVYTHATNNGVLMLDSHTGNIVESSKYFKQKNIYYGEGGGQNGNFEAWSAFPVGRTTSDEIGQYFYNGSGGINISPPLSWIFEPNFMVSYSDSSLHIMRFKDIYERMKLMYPYFVYDFGVRTSQNGFNVNKIGSILVTDGKDTYWLMPLVVLLDTSHVPWSSGDMLRLVGYALINAYNGHVQLIVNGDDSFSKMFFEQNKRYNNDVVTEIPEWLGKQIQYPKEMFMWKISKFNQYHITDPKAFIEAQQFYEVPADDPMAYYIIAKPLGFHNPEFVGLQSLKLQNSPARNLVGYMLVQNNLENLGRMTFYSISVDSSTKLSPTAAREALEKDPIYAKEKLLLNNPRVGDNVFYRLGDQEVYFIPVYTVSTAGGVATQTQLGTIATVGASATGNFYVGLGNTPQQSFQNYLLKMSNLSTTEQKKTNETLLDKPSRIEKLEKIFIAAGLTLSKPTVISLPLAFKEADADYLSDSDFAKAETIISKFIKGFSSSGGGRIFEWQADNKVNFGILKDVNGIIENHYVSIEVG